MKTFITLSALFIYFISNSQYQGPISKILSGYGSDGTDTVEVINISNDHFSGKDISVFFPKGTVSPIPTIFYSHGYAANDTNIHIETLRHFAAKGYAVVFTPYKTIGIGVDNTERYATLFDGFTKAADSLPNIIDTSRVGFFGQSFGGGATVRISYRAFTENNWGINGKFIYCSAQWYSMELGDTVTSDFPTDCNMLTVLYADDDVNDHRLGIEIFNNISIPDSSKDLLIVHSDTVNGYNYQSDHTMPGQYSSNAEFDALDYFTTYRLMEALADYTFTGNLSAKEISLGNGHFNQINMGDSLTPLSWGYNYTLLNPESFYDNPCGDTITNERSQYCNSFTTNTFEEYSNHISIYPNPTSDYININYNSDFSYHLFSSNGILLKSGNNTNKIDLTNLPFGMYFIHIRTKDSISIKKVIKK